MKISSVPPGFPPNAKLAFKGVIFEVWQWEQKMYDGSTAIFERLRRADSAEIIAVIGDKIIIQEQTQPDWPGPRITLPSGMCKWDENPLTCAKRELREESGRTTGDWTQWKKSSPDGKIVWTIHTYIARNCERTEEPEPDDDGEKISEKLISFDEFLELADEPRFRDRLIIPELLRAQYNKAYRVELKKTIFG